jgi:anti-sigma B factor antagonist
MASIEFRVKVVKSSDGTTATLAEVDGSIDASTIQEFQQIMDKLVERGVKNLILDCSNIRYINSTGLGTLLKYSDTFESIGGHIAFCRVPSKVMLVMEMLGFNALFNIVPDEATALRSFAGKMPPSSVLVTRAGRSAATSSIVTTPARLTTPMAGFAVSFPLQVMCARCRVTLDIPAAGKYKCPRCGTLLAAEESSRVRFFVSKKGQPLSITLPCQTQTAAHVAELAGQCAADAGAGAEAARAVADAVGAACKNIIERAYHGDPVSSFHVLIAANGSALMIKLADHGKPFDFGPGGSIQSDGAFAPAIDNMDLVEYQLHPRGGNVVTMIKGFK